MTNPLCACHLPEQKHSTVDAKDSPENKVGRQPVDSLRDLLPEPESWRSGCVEGGTSTRGPATMGRVPTARGVEHSEDGRRRFSPPCRGEVRPCPQLYRATPECEG